MNTLPAPVGAPRRHRVAKLIPVFVCICTLALIGWVAWPTLRPVRSVTVSQVVFDRSSVVQPVVDEAGDTQRNVPTVQAAGWLEAEPFYVACAALADGIVESVEVLEGDRVVKGQVVARLIADDAQLRLRSAEARLAQADAMRAVREAELVGAQSAWDEPVELRRAVATGRAALEEAQGELARLPMHIESARATYVRLQEELKRVRRSSESGVINELEVIVAEQRALSQGAAVRAIEAEEPVLQARIDRLRAELVAAERHLELRIADRRRLDEAKANVASAIAARELAEAMRDEAALELERMEVRAPITGYVQERLKSPGDKAIRMMDSPESAHILHLYDPERMQVRVDVPLADASYVSIGQRCEVVVEVLPDRTFMGEVLRITHEADLQKNTLQVKVKVLDPDPVLRPEMLTRVKFVSGSGARSGDRTERPAAKTRVLVQSTMLDTQGQGVRVWTITNRRGDRGTLMPQTVEVVQETDGWATVSGELQPGTLLTTPTKGARAGELVAIEIGENGDGGAAS